MFMPQCAPASVTTGQTIRKNWQIVPPAWKKKVSIKGWLRNVTLNGGWDAQLVLSVHMFLSMRIGLQICKAKDDKLHCLSGLLEVVGANYFQTAQKKSSMKWGTESWNYIRDPFEKSASLPGSQSPPGITGYLNNPGVPSIDVGWTEWIGIFFNSNILHTAVPTNITLHCMISIRSAHIRRCSSNKWMHTES